MAISKHLKSPLIPVQSLSCSLAICLVHLYGSQVTEEQWRGIIVQQHSLNSVRCSATVGCMTCNNSKNRLAHSHSSTIGELLKERNKHRRVGI